LRCGLIIAVNLKSKKSFMLEHGRKILTVSELTGKVKSTLEENFNIVWVVGEISNLRLPSSGHIYFVLKDRGSQIRTVIFRSKARYLPKFKDGSQVLLRGAIGVYEVRGEYQIIGEYLELYGVGNLQTAFELLKEKLHCEGLFEQRYKKSLPFFPKSVGVITSSTGAAIRDVLNVTSRRYPSARVTIYPSLVQGNTAPAELRSGIKFFNAMSTPPDVILLTRGGGSLEDLWAFNDEELARDIFASAVPVVSAIGHEIDFTISDFVADVRAPTPSAAAEIIFPEIQSMYAAVSLLRKSLLNAWSKKIEKKRIVFFSLSRQLSSFHPQKKVNQYFQRIDDLNKLLVVRFRVILNAKLERLYRTNLKIAPPDIKAMREKLKNIEKEISTLIMSPLERKKVRLESAVLLLRSCQPDNILKRGYAICRKLDGGIIINASEVDAADKVSVQLSQGTLSCNVEEVS